MQDDAGSGVRVLGADELEDVVIIEQPLDALVALEGQNQRHNCA